MTFFFTFVFMFLVYWRPQEWLVPWLFGIPMLNGVIGLSLLTLLVEIDTGKIRFPKELPQFWLLLGLYISFLTSHIAHFYFAGLMDSFEEPFKYCLFMTLFITVLDSPRKLRWLAWLVVVMAAVMSVHLILQQVQGYGFVGQRPIQVGWIGNRPPFTRSMFFGIFEDPNDAGQFVVSAIPFAFVLFRRRSFWSFMIGLGLAFLFVRALGATHSRGAQVGLVALLGMVAVLKLPQQWMPVLVPLGLVGVLALMPLAGRGLDMSARERVVMWGLSNSHLIRNPLSLLFGLGYGMSYQIADLYGMKGLTMHNAFVYCYVEIGYFGFIFWFGLIVAGMMGCWLVRKELIHYQKEQTELGYVWRYAGMAICSMMAFCASGYFLSRAFIYPMFFLMVTLGAVSRIGKEALYDSGDADDIDLPVGFLELPTNFWIFYPIVAGVGIVYVWLSCRMLNLGI